MSRIYVAGFGAVSPAGWSAKALCDALGSGRPLPIHSLERPGWKRPLRARLAPNPEPRPEFLGHPRLRRASPITQYAAAAALESSAGLRGTESGKSTLGVIVCLQSGCVRYSRRFFEETIANPASASPLLFPETVYAGPASHVAALLGEVPLACTLVGDPACFLQGVAIGVQWLIEGAVDACVIVGAEETDWLLADALWHLDRPAVLAGGAGALCLSREPGVGSGAELAAISDPHTFCSLNDRARAALAMRRQLGGNPQSELLCDGLGNGSRAEAAERAAWRDWSGARLSPKGVIGEGLMARAAWQCVAACEAVATGRFTGANVSLVGPNQQAIGARFVAAAYGPEDLAMPAPMDKVRA